MRVRDSRDGFQPCTRRFLVGRNLCAQMAVYSVVVVLCEKASLYPPYGAPPPVTPRLSRDLIHELAGHHPIIQQPAAQHAPAPPAAALFLPRIPVTPSPALLPPSSSIHHLSRASPYCPSFQLLSRSCTSSVSSSCTSSENAQRPSQPGRNSSSRRSCSCAPVQSMAHGRVRRLSVNKSSLKCQVDTGSVM